MKISIVTTLYRSANFIPEFSERVRQAAAKIADTCEIIFVNDGSPDNSLEAALKVREQYPDVKVVDLSRNFGHHKAIMTGLSYASGDHVFLIDCDLEEPPEVLAEFYEKMKATDADVIYGVQSKRQDPLLNRLTGALFYGFFNSLSQYPIPRNLLTVRLMKCNYVQQLLNHQEQEFIIAVLWEMTGFKQIPVVVEKAYKGSTTYNLRRKLHHVLRSVTSTSNKPLIYIAYLGFLMTIPSGLYILFIILRYTMFGVASDGWTSLIVSVWFLGGLNILILGIISFYLSVIFIETKKRPYTIVRQVYE